MLKPKDLINSILRRLAQALHLGIEEHDQGPVHSAYNPSFLAYFFSRNSIFLSQQISQQCFSADLSAQPNGSQLVRSH
jgi:hypothetical protein